MRYGLSILLAAALLVGASELDTKAGSPAARQGDQQICPLVTGGIPHSGGPILTGSATVLICGQPAARVADVCSCVGSSTSIAVGSQTVFINGRPAARQGSVTNHGGTVVSGCGTVTIGD